jgi:vacuolar-type H+-ATPase subunit D/Vma8
MTSSATKKEVNSYLPLLSSKQQNLVLEMIKTFLTIDNSSKRITRKQYNKEIEEAVKRIDKGEYVAHNDALNELSKW